MFFIAFNSAYHKTVVLDRKHILIRKTIFISFFLYLDKSYRSLIALILPVIFTYFVIFLYGCFTQNV